MKDIRKLSLEKLSEYVEQIGEPKFRASQIYDWIWKKNAHSFDQMTNLSKSLRERLVSDFKLLPIAILDKKISSDGTIKNAVKLHDGAIVESVLIPTESRTTACISSQVGCSLDCEFCATAKLKRMRNLTAAEIVDQVVEVHKTSLERYDRPLSNIVYMGMGEPLLNYLEVVESIQKITTDQGLGMSPKRITVSTSGIPKMIKKLADENLRVNLALSLHSAREEVRQEIMPFSEKFPLSEVIEAMQYWYDTTQIRPTIEYIAWKGVNDTPQDIKALVGFCKKFPCKVNLIEYNMIEGESFQGASNRVIESYISELERNRIVVNVRRSRGKDIDAACGQLANKNVF